VLNFGEQQLRNGSVDMSGLSDTNPTITWHVPPGTYQRLMTHEYITFRFVEVIGAISPPDVSGAGGWKASNPWAPTDVTTFVSSSPALDRVFDLARYTVLNVPMDVSTDSNARQRDSCNWDVYLTSRYLGGVAMTSTGERGCERSLVVLVPPYTTVLACRYGGVSPSPRPLYVRVLRQPQ
jgi:hypothetical protein